MGTTARNIAWITDVDRASLHNRKSTVSFSKQVVTFFDIVAGTLILLNSMTLTLSLDYSVGWQGWTVMESTFTIFFALEIAGRIAVLGWRVHLLGEDRWWNLFDLCVVLIGVVDTLLGWFDYRVGAGSVSTFRTLRILRIAKMVRVLRIKAFKELRLMVNGLLAGMRTLFWAFVFLFFFILTLGILTKSLMQARESEVLWCQRLKTVPCVSYASMGDLVGDPLITGCGS